MISDKLLSLVKEFEGCKLTAYQDIVGVWTIGYGCTGHDIGPGVVWTQEQADNALVSRLEALQTDIEGIVNTKLTQNQLDALTSFAYNLGLAALQRSTLLKKVNNLDAEGAAQAFLSWCNAGGHEVPGLLRRRQAEAALFLS